VATFWVWYRVGSRNEYPGRTGVSHWVEHMLFKGTPTLPKGEIDRLVARDGGTFNAMTWLDWTAYFTTLPAERISLALKLEADRMVNSLFDPDEVSSERTVIISEREGHENSPVFLLSEEIQSSAIKAHPYHHEVIGWKSDLHTMTRADLYEHYRRHYHPGNAVAVAVGAIDPDEILTQIEATFGQLEAGDPPEPVQIVEPEQRGERRVLVVGDDETSYVVAAYPAPAAADPDYFPFQILDTVLGGAKSMNLFGGGPTNRSSRLYRALVDTRHASAVACGMAATLDPYLFTVSATVRAGEDADRVETVMLDEIARLRDGGITSDELARAKKQARAQFAYSAESVTSQGFWLGFAEVLVGQDWLDRHLDHIDAVTREDVSRVAGKYLTDHRRTVGRYRPRAEAA
jgi:zinc protease